MRIFLSNAEKTLQFYASGNLISDDGFCYQPSKLNYYVLIMVKEGTLYISQNGANYEIKKNQYILLRPEGEQFGYRASVGKLSYLWVQFTFKEPVIIQRNYKWMREYFDAGYLKLQNGCLIFQNGCYIVPERGEVSLTQRVPLLFNQLLDLSRQEPIYSKRIIDYALSLLVMELSQEFIEKKYIKKNDIPSNLDYIMEWIKANYDKEITVKEIADEMGYNQNYLSSLFKKSTGVSLVQYINMTRINIAKSMITNRDVSIKEVAYSCGFINEKYFMKVFKKVEGMTPSQYKKAFSKKRLTRDRSKMSSI